MRGIQMYSDGSYIPTSGKGGYAAIIKNGKRLQTITGSVLHSSCNQMELMAVIQGLSVVKPFSAITIITDSAYIERAVNDGRLNIWQTNGWRRIRTLEPIKYADLWRQYLRIIREKKLVVKIRKIDAHKGHSLNERVDFLARQAAKSA